MRGQPPNPARSINARVIGLAVLVQLLVLSACRPGAALPPTSAAVGGRITAEPVATPAPASTPSTAANERAAAPSPVPVRSASPAARGSIVAVPSPGVAARPASGQTIKFGSIHALSGPLAASGVQMDHAIKLAVDAVNAQGGIKLLGGRPLEAVAGDIRSNPQVPQTLIDGGVVALIGTYHSDATLSLAGLAERSQVPLIIDASVADNITQQSYRYTFRVQPNATVMGLFGARYLKEMSTAAGQPIRTIAYIHDSSALATDVFDAFRGEAERQGMHITREVSYQESNADLSVAATQALTDRPQVLAVTGTFDDGVTLAKNLGLMQPRLQAVWGVADEAFDAPGFAAAVQEDGNGVFNANYRFDASSSTLQNLRKVFKQQFGDEMQNEAVFAYQDVLLLADALERAGSTDPAAVRDALARTNLPSDLIGLTGPIRFDIRGENVGAAPIVEQVQQGQVYQVYPSTAAEKPPIFPAVPWSS
jgi:branched-chain amino acid transport system substrate-binding protein